jgi:hypothetical protein
MASGKRLGMHGQLEEILSDAICNSERIPRSVLEHGRNPAPAGLRGASSASQRRSWTFYEAIKLGFNKIFMRQF